jgi:hypothetical protein
MLKILVESGLENLPYEDFFDKVKLSPKLEKCQKCQNDIYRKYQLLTDKQLGP